MTSRSSPAGTDRLLDDDGGTTPDQTNRTTRQDDIMNFVVYSDNGGLFHWRLDNEDGEPVAVSHAAFPSADAARRAAGEVHDHAGSATGAES